MTNTSSEQTEKNDEIVAQVKRIIVDKLGVDESEVTPEASFTTDLKADSLDTVELVMEFEKEFNISIADEDAEKFKNVGAVIEYLTAIQNDNKGDESKSN